MERRVNLLKMSDWFQNELKTVGFNIMETHTKQDLEEALIKIKLIGKNLNITR